MATLDVGSLPNIDLNREEIPAPPPSGLFTPLADALVTLGDWTAFSLRALTGVFTRHLKKSELLLMCLLVGYSSITVIAVTGLFIGMVLAVQTYVQFHQIGLDTSLGAVIHMSVVRELGPVLTAGMLAGRVGSAMAAELATMRVTEQLDALACLGVDPVRYLVAPRFLACVLMIPLLTIIADIMGLVGSTFVCLRVYGIDSYHYWEHTQAHVGLFDVSVGLVKSIFFGGIIALISCHRGFHGSAGAQGVGKAATQAFVASFVAILAMDFVFGLVANSLQDMLWPPNGAKTI
jgi:phospholipid/cholesterol/gamma-HCH transport system permease protein